MEKEKYLYDDSMNAIPTYDKDEINTMVGVIDCEWATSGAVNRFVTSANDGNKIKLASSDSYVSGVSVYQHGSIVTIQTLGIVNVEDDGTLKAGQKCMPNNEGKAVLSSNNLGYRVLGRVDATHISMIVAPNVDMIQRAKVRDGELQNDINNLSYVKLSYGEMIDNNLDLNNYVTTGMYRVGTALHTPRVGEYGYLSVVQHSELWCEQTFYSLDWNPRIFVRARIEGTWHDWREVFTQTNIWLDGSTLMISTL